MYHTLLISHPMKGRRLWGGLFHHRLSSPLRDNHYFIVPSLGNRSPLLTIPTAAVKKYGHYVHSRPIRSSVSFSSLTSLPLQQPYLHRKGKSCHFSSTSTNSASSSIDELQDRTRALFDRYDGGRLPLGMDDFWSAIQQLLVEWTTIDDDPSSYPIRLQYIISILDRLAQTTSPTMMSMEGMSGISLLEDDEDEEAFSSSTSHHHHHQTRRKQREKSIGNAMVELWRRIIVLPTPPSQPTQHQTAIPRPSELVERIDRYRQAGLIQPTTHTYHLLLEGASAFSFQQSNTYRQQQQPAAQFVSELMDQLCTTSNHNLSQLDGSVNSFGDDAGSSDAERGFLQQQVLVNEKTFTIVMKHWMRHEQPQQVDFWFRRLCQLDGRGDVVVKEQEAMKHHPLWSRMLFLHGIHYQLALTAAARSGNVSRAERLLKEQIELFVERKNQTDGSSDNSGDAEKAAIFRCAPNSASFHAVLDAWARRHAYDQQQQKQRRHQRGDVAEAPSASVTTTADQQEPIAHHVQAERLVSIMTDLAKNHGLSSCRPDGYTVSNLVRCLLISVLHPKQIEHRMKALIRDINTAATKKQHRKDDKEEVETRNNPSSSSSKATEGHQQVQYLMAYNALLHGYAKLGDARNTERLLKEMIPQQQPDDGDDGTIDMSKNPDEYSFHAVFLAWSNVKQSRDKEDAPLQVEAWMAIMKEDFHMTPTFRIYSSVMQAWKRSRRQDAPDRVEELLQEVLATRYDDSRHPDNDLTVLYNIAIATWGQHSAQFRDPRGVDRSWGLLQELLQDERLQPSGQTFRAILQGIVGSTVTNKLDRAHAVVDMMDQRGIPLSRSDQKIMKRLQRGRSNTSRS